MIYLFMLILFLKFSFQEFLPLCFSDFALFSFLDLHTMTLYFLYHFFRIIE